MLKHKMRYVCVAGLSILLMMASFVWAEESENIVENPSAEEIEGNGRPVYWGFYVGNGKAIWGTSTEEFHSGERSVFMRPTEYGVISSGSLQGKMQVLCAISVGASDGHRGYLGDKKAYRALPDTEYQFSLWLKSDGVDRVSIIGIGWNTEDAQSGRQFFKTSLSTVLLTKEWQPYGGVFTTEPDTKRFALQVRIDERKDREANVMGTVYVDDVVMYPTQSDLAR